MQPFVTSVWFVVLSLCCNTLMAQHALNGSFPQHAGAEVRLQGFEGLESSLSFGQTQLDENGNFKLSYPDTYSGMGLLEIKEAGSLLLILGEDGVQLHGSSIQDYASLKISNSIENDFFDAYVKQQGSRNAKLEGWKWLKPLYAKEGKSTEVYSGINKEIARLEGEEAQFLQNIPKNYYAVYYLPLRKLIEDRPASINRYTERIPQHIADFKTYDLASPKLAHSGLMEQFYEGHFILLESYDDITTGYPLMKESVDHIIAALSGHEDQLLEVSEYLFKLFEKRSLFPAAEYLSLQMLTQNSCTVEGELERRFEQYNTMKPGNQAPEIAFTAAARKGFKQQEKSLYAIKSKYKLVAFWASWCAHCMQELPQLQTLYPKLQEKDMEVIAISLDTDETAYQNAIQNHPWVTYCDFTEWNSPAVQDYYVFSTPSFYLLDENNTILKKIKSVAQLEAIVDSVLPNP